MDTYIVQVKDRDKIDNLKKYGRIIYVSKFINTLAIEVSEHNIDKLRADSNVISVKINEYGVFYNL